MAKGETLGRVKCHLGRFSLDTLPLALYLPIRRLLTEGYLMRSALSISVIILALTATVLSVRSQTPDPKAASANLKQGTYYWSDGAWHSMLQLTMSGAGGKHMAKVFVPGLTPQMVYTYRDAMAPVQVKEEKPLFCVKFNPLLTGSPYAPSPRDIVIARFDEKKDHRELQITSGGNMATFKSGLGKDRMPDLTLTPIDDTTVLFSPAEGLREGEYIISTVAMGYSGFDFGFHTNKRK